MVNRSVGTQKFQHYTDKQNATKMTNNQHKKNREKTFSEINKSISEFISYESSNSLLGKGDSLLILKKIPSHSVSLILTDPPYHSTKKDNIYGDTKFKEDNHYLNWMSEYATEWARILRPNGSLFLFCSTVMSARLECILYNKFKVLSHIVWTKPNDPGFDGWKGKMRKEALRQWYAHSERILFAEPAVEGNLNRSSFANFLRNARKQTGITAHKLAEVTDSYGNINHGGAVSNWETGRNIPSRDQYEKICFALESTGKNLTMPPYEDVIRPFLVNSSKEFTDVWTFPSVRPYQGKHPAEKPTNLLLHAIESTTYPFDIVLDCFGGSGSTVLAAISLGRLAVTMEIEDKWVDRITNRLKEATAKLNSKTILKTSIENPLIATSTSFHLLEKRETMV